VTPESGTVDGALRRALDAYAALTELGEEVEDEWTYVEELSEAWRDRLEDVAAERNLESIDPIVASALDSAVEEIGRIADPHRAIDWLSTFPQIVLTALGERP
jgi:hypothetical protein